MDSSEWRIRCSARLHAQWPRLQRQQRDEVAAELAADPRWRPLEPEEATAQWLHQGIPADPDDRHVG